MLLPSALSCPRPAGRPRLQASLFTSPPASPPAQSASTTLFQACLSLQSMLQSPLPKSALAPSPFFNEPAQSLHQSSQEQPHQRRQLPTPPMRNASLPSPMKLRLRSYSHKSGNSPECSSTPKLARKKVAKRQPPPRGVNKRRRDDEDEDMEKENEEIDVDTNELKRGPSTPKRVRVVPEEIPLGLDRRDFEMLHDNHQYTSTPTNALGFSFPSPRNVKEKAEKGQDQGTNWSTEEDRQLVELVLQKLRLNRSDWQDCARSLGRNSRKLEQRWQSLLGAGEIGLKGNARQERRSNSATWR